MLFLVPSIIRKMKFQQSKSGSQTIITSMSSQYPFFSTKTTDFNKPRLKKYLNNHTMPLSRRLSRLTILVLQKMMSWIRLSASRAHALLNKATRPFVMIDTTAFVDDPNFKKFVELFFGEGTETTYRQEWFESYTEEPALKILYIHTPHLEAEKANQILFKFIELMDEMKDYPINLIVDVIHCSQEDYLKRELEIKVEDAFAKEVIESETK